jgi:hypothetical protein
MKKLILGSLLIFTAIAAHAGNIYEVSFCSKGTGPAKDRIEALNDAGVREQIKAKYPGAYSIVVIQIPKPAKKSGEL